MNMNIIICECVCVLPSSCSPPLQPQPGQLLHPLWRHLPFWLCFCLWRSLHCQRPGSKKRTCWFFFGLKIGECHTIWIQESFSWMLASFPILSVCTSNILLLDIRLSVHLLKRELLKGLEEKLGVGKRCFWRRTARAPASLSRHSSIRTIVRVRPGGLLSFTSELWIFCRSWIRLKTADFCCPLYTPLHSCWIQVF